MRSSAQCAGTGSRTSSSRRSRRLGETAGSSEQPRPAARRRLSSLRRTSRAPSGVLPRMRGPATAGSGRARAPVGGVAAPVRLVSGRLVLARGVSACDRDRRHNGSDRPQRCGRAERAPGRDARRAGSRPDDRPGNGDRDATVGIDGSGAPVDALDAAAPDHNRAGARSADILARRPNWVHRRPRIHPEQLGKSPRGRPRPGGVAGRAAAGRRSRLGSLFKPPPRVFRRLQRDLQLAGAGRRGPDDGGGKRFPRRLFEANNRVKQRVRVLRRGNARPDFVTGPWVL